MKQHWDIFCKVVDNYGDIGVAWRLARQLVAEHGLAVRLWVDNLQAFTPLCPEADPRLARQWQAGVQVRHWAPKWVATDMPAVVIEAFGCKLPPGYVTALHAQAGRTLWLNLEYLSAEAWVGGCHGLPSHGGPGYQKSFFFPGFRPDTGGLLRERDLLAQRRGFQAAERAAFLARLGVAPAEGALLCSLFAYENPGLAAWLQAMASGACPVHLLVPQGRIQGELAAWLGEVPQVGQPYRRGALAVQPLPFVAQSDYDRLLWACDFNAVRGEDSFVRAQWAGRPLLWHIYPQEEDAHRIKLEAFLELYLAGLDAPARQALGGLHRAWNFGGNMGLAWQGLVAHRAELTAHAEHWCASLAARPDLATALVQFYRNWL
ncbi:elongation factor P maturation arginine rhamnosyltransferase EarP [Pseudomonas typographi]|uniref:Protein-arginine rhamnosyltransferase n=1 Tax=Pseudomonas typographi TaxID=2715964 RepID=A0ABR7YYB9_9PSED|nr:elongation factor P maturation arginine rhamnosyltransferase EarP [Pseudomonas typographi]MBD1598196.1 elongation factor P maturation arginine rhamnosyltransferase EarP [Pseudomonas typographi]